MCSSTVMSASKLKLWLLSQCGHRPSSRGRAENSITAVFLCQGTSILSHALYCNSDACRSACLEFFRRSADHQFPGCFLACDSYPTLVIILFLHVINFILHFVNILMVFLTFSPFLAAFYLQIIYFSNSRIQLFYNISPKQSKLILKAFRASLQKPSRRYLPRLNYLSCMIKNTPFPVLKSNSAHSIQFSTNIMEPALS